MLCAGRYAVVLYLSWDVGGEHFRDLPEFPPLDPEADEAGEVVTKDAATDVVRVLLATGGGDERTISWWLESLARRTGRLHIDDKIYWPAGRSWTAEEIVDHAWSCTPIAL